MLALDLDPSHGRGSDDPTAQVSNQAEAITALAARLGGRVLGDVSPSGGRHLYVLFAAPLPWRELRDPAKAMARRFPAIDTTPMSSLGGQISPPGSRHKSGGWRLLTLPLEDAGHPCGPEVWDGLLTEFAAEPTWSPVTSWQGFSMPGCSRRATLHSRPGPAKMGRDICPRIPGVI